MAEGKDRDRWAKKQKIERETGWKKVGKDGKKKDKNTQLIKHH